MLIGGVETPYTLGDEYCFAEDVTGEIEVSINGTMTFTDACDPIDDLESTKQFPIPPNDVNCALTDAIAVCVEVEPNCYTFEPSGNFATLPAWIGYKIVCDGEEIYWTNADDVFKCSEDFEVYLVVLFCDTCSTYCQPIPTICTVDDTCPTGVAALTCDECILTVSINGYSGYDFELTDPNGISLGAVDDGDTFDIGSPNGIDGIYTLKGTLASCLDVEVTLNHDVTYAGVSGSTDL